MVKYADRHHHQHLTEWQVCERGAVTNGKCWPEKAHTVSIGNILVDDRPGKVTYHFRGEPETSTKTHDRMLHKKAQRWKKRRPWGNFYLKLRCRMDYCLSSSSRWWRWQGIVTSTAPFRLAPEIWASHEVINECWSQTWDIPHREARCPTC